MHPVARRRARFALGCAPFRLLRPSTLHCTRKESVVEGEGAQQTERGAADAGPRSCGRRSGRRGRSAVLSGALMKPVRAGARVGWRLIGRVRWSPWPGGRRGRSSRARRSSATDPERVGALGDPHRIPILALWEDRSAPHPATSASQPRNHAEIAERIRGAGPNDPPGAPYPAPGGLRGSLLRLMGPRDPCESLAAAMLRARTRSARPAAPAAAVRGVDGAGEGGRRVTFGCVGGAAHPGNGVIAPLRDGRGAGRKVKDARRPPF